MLETEYLGHALPDGPPPAPATGPGDHVGVHLQKDGRHYVGAAPVVGRDQRRRAHRARRPHGGRRHRPGAPHPAPEARRARRRAGRPSTTSSPGLDELGLVGRARARSAGTRWPAPASSSASSPSSRPRPPPPRRSPSSSGASPTSPTGSTPRSPSTSTAAPTPAPASRSPTSASRAMIVTVDGEQEPGLPGAPRRGPRLRRPRRGRPGPHRARPQGHRRRPARPRRAPRAPLARPARGRRDVLRAGPTASTRRSCDDRRPPRPRHHGGRRHAERSTDELRALADARRPRARAGRHRRRGRRLGRAHLPGHARRRVQHGGCRAAARSSRSTPPASTCSSSTPATTSPRPTAPARRSPTSSTSPSSTCCRSSPSPSRTPSTARACTSATRPPAAGCARSSRSRRRWRGYEAWVTGIRRDEGPTRADTPLVTFDEQFGLVKLNPLAAWTFDEVVDYANDHRVPVNLASLRRLPVDRLRAVHPAGRARRRPARRALGRVRQDRVRAAPVTTTDTLTEAPPRDDRR